jgi:hypothetical protein
MEPTAYQQLGFSTDFVFSRAVRTERFEDPIGYLEEILSDTLCGLVVKILSNT